jgi:hypothetical protein
MLTINIAKTIINVSVSKTVHAHPFRVTLVNKISTSNFLSEETMKQAGAPP